MGDELRGENLVHLNVRFSTETELKKIQDFLYEKSGQGVSFTGLVEAMVNEVTIAIFKIGTSPQRIFNLGLRQNKSGGRFFALRLVDGFNLFGFGGNSHIEET